MNLDDKLSLVAREVLAKLNDEGDEDFVASGIHGIVMMWLDERVLVITDPRIDRITSDLASLAATMQHERAKRGLDPRVVDPPGTAS